MISNIPYCVKVKARFLEDDWKEMQLWLNENDPEHRTKYYGKARVWEFHDPNLAMRFKLTFGGK